MTHRTQLRATSDQLGEQRRAAASACAHPVIAATTVASSVRASASISGRSSSNMRSILVVWTDSGTAKAIGCAQTSDCG